MNPIVIVGGGIAGLTLGIGLRRRGVPVTLIEAGRYPRHRVCGEFISGRGQDRLKTIGMAAAIEDACVPAHTGRFFYAGLSSPTRRLEMPAWCISRYVLDALLAATFRSLGGELATNTRWRGEADEPGIVLAGGREPARPSAAEKWYGLKVHARGVELGTDLEMHRVPGGYVGLCRLPGGEVNICGLFRRQSNQDASHDLLKGAENSVLRQRTAAAVRDPDSHCAVAGLDLAGRWTGDPGEFRVGDRLGMIAPVTGNGMSLAIESAVLALPHLDAYSRGDCRWPETCRRFEKEARCAFAPRIRWGRRLHRVTCSAISGASLAKFLLNSALLWQFFWRRIR